MRRRVHTDLDDLGKMEKDGDWLQSIGELFFSEEEMRNIRHYLDQALQLGCPVCGKSI